MKLYAANSTVIDTFGQRTITVNVNLRRTFTWTFILANTAGAIIGADFLYKFNLLVDIHNGKLVDNLTHLSVSGIVSHSSVYSVETYDSKYMYADILQEFSQVTAPQEFMSTIQHNTCHRIITQGPPIHERPRRLSPENLPLAKKEFQNMVKLGICRPSKSPWASPLQLVKKKNQEWRPCGDYRKLNGVTVADRYPIPHIYDFGFLLTNKTVFYTLDLTRAYHQILMHPDVIEKTAIITPFGLFEFMRMGFGLKNAAQTF